MGMANPGTNEYEKMIDYMRQDLESGMALTKIEMSVRKRMKEEGRDFDVEFKKWKENKNKK